MNGTLTHSLMLAGPSVDLSFRTVPRPIGAISPSHRRSLARPCKHVCKCSQLILPLNREMILFRGETEIFPLERFAVTTGTGMWSYDEASSSLELVYTGRAFMDMINPRIVGDGETCV